MNTQANLLYRRLPGVDDLLRRPEIANLSANSSREAVVRATRAALQNLREQLRTGVVVEAGLQDALGDLPSQVKIYLNAEQQPRLRRVINGTGVLLQTNLGRAPLSSDALQHLCEIAAGYCNLEYSLQTGDRGQRDVHAESLLLDLLASKAIGLTTEADTQQGTNEKPLAGAVVNNCAAATFLALNTLAEGGEVIVSRGELVEIGGGFRIPEILAKSGAVLREVGTTNKTRIQDYAAAITQATRLILRVHRSNFRMEGFTEQPSIKELVSLGLERGVPLFDDQGTGCIYDLNAVGLAGESSWLTSLNSGASLVACSGDKLLGGPQCGLLVGRPELIARLRSNPLFRALRVDKLTYAALESTLLAYLTGREATIPVLGMLQGTVASIRERCEKVIQALGSVLPEAEVIAVQSVVGGGTTPGASLPSFAISLRHVTLAEHDLAAKLRSLRVPVIARINDGRVLLDLRTVQPHEDAELVSLLWDAFAPDERNRLIAGAGNTE